MSKINIRRVKALSLPEIGDVQVQSLKLTEYLDIAAQRRTDKELADLTDTEFLIYLMPHTIFRKNGDPVFTDPDDWNQYLGIHISLSAEIFEAVTYVTGLGEKSTESAEKK